MPYVTVTQHDALNFMNRTVSVGPQHSEQPNNKQHAIATQSMTQKSHTVMHTSSPGPIGP